MFKQQISGNVCENRVSPLSEPPFQAEQTEEMSGPLVDHSKWPIIIPCFEVKGSLLNCQKDIERQYLRSFAHRKKKHCVLPFPGAKGGLSRLVSCPKPKMWPFFPRPSAECSWWLELRDRVSKTHEAGSLAKQCRLLKEPLEWPSIFRLVYVLDVCLEPIKITTDVLVKNEQLNTANKNKNKKRNSVFQPRLVCG